MEWSSFASYPRKYSDRVLRKLRQLNAAQTLEDSINSPGNREDTSLEETSSARDVRLEALKGNREGQYSIRVNQQWRICFAWNDGNASGVEIVDYH